jgi:hypothetical protein
MRNNAGYVTRITPARFSGIAALWHVELQPGLLHLVQNAILLQPFDRRDRLAGDLADWNLA